MHREECCGNCKWWNIVISGPGGTNAGTLAQCRRMPPQLVSDCHFPETRFPETHPHSWCGEFDRRPTYLGRALSPVPEAAQLLGMSVALLKSMVSKGEIKHIKDGRRKLIDLDAAKRQLSKIMQGD
jgi:excisionase family DNA binding protein